MSVHLKHPFQLIKYQYPPLSSFIVMRFTYTRLLSVLILISSAISRSLEVEPRQQAPAANQPAANAPSPRYVYVITDVSTTDRAVSPKTGKPIFDMHTALHIDGTDTDGPMRIEIAVNPTALDTQGYVIRVKDLGVANSGKPIGFWSSMQNARRYVVQNGQTTLTNAEIFDHDSGRGMAVDAWKVNPVYSRGTGSSPNTCIDFVDNMLAQMNLDLDPAMSKIFADGDEYYTYNSEKFVMKLPNFWSVKTDLPDNYKPPPGVDSWTRIYEVLSQPDKSTMIADSSQVTYCTKSRKSKRDCTQTAEFTDDAWYSDTVTLEEVSNLATTPPPDEAKLATIDEESRPAAAPFQDTVAKPGTAGTGLATIGLGRASGVISSLVLVAGEVAEAAGLAIGPAFVLLDLVNGNWLGAGLAAVGIALGVAASLAVAGPVGWIVGGAIAALFAILPGLFKKKSTPNIGDRQAILQYAFFGDPTHTGNEQCQSQGNSNCTAVFGPGVLSMIFDWNNFDSVAFLIQFNQGYAMTLPEIANSFYNVDDPSNKGADGSTQMATIKCNNIKGHSNAFGGFDGDDTSKCNHPSFQLNRQAILLPVINQTADKIYNRIIPNPGGDCKLINDAANSLNIPEYNMTITGQPVAIACNLSASEVIGGTVIPLNPTNNLQGTNVSAGNSSTDGQNGHQISVPAPTPFLQLLNATNAVCLSGSGGSLCVPAGQYDIQRGSLGFDSSKADTLTMPPGASIRWYDISESMPHTGSTRTLVSFTTNETPANKYFANAMSSAPTSGANGAGAIWNATLPAGILDPPVICLFTKTDHNGDVACFGPGGGNVTAGIAGKSSSIAVHGGATAEIYAQYYGDAGSATVTSDVMDLSQELYGAGGSFDQKIVAMRVCVGSCGVD